MPFDAIPDAALQTPFARKRTGARNGAAMRWAAAPFEAEPVAVAATTAAPASEARRRRGATSHRAGLAAEDAVARRYAASGGAVLARRWRCEHGEIDLVIREPDAIVFVEVKRRARPVEDDPIRLAQWRRLDAAVETYIFAAETGDAPTRFDVALVGADGTIEVTKNARC